MNRLESLRDHLALKPVQEVGGKWYFREVDVAAETGDLFDRISRYEIV